MISLSDEAKTELAKFFETNEASAVRICVQEDEAGKQFLGMVLDEAVPEEDQIFEAEGYSFIVDNELAGMLQAIRVDVTEGEFIIMFKAAQASCGCGCGSSCGEGENCGDDCDCSSSASCGCGHSH